MAVPAVLFRPGSVESIQNGRSAGRV